MYKRVKLDCSMRANKKESRDLLNCDARQSNVSIRINKKKKEANKKYIKRNTHQNNKCMYSHV